jgi:hypothetical protein
MHETRLRFGTLAAQGFFSGAAVAWPLAARAQQATKLPRRRAA